MRLPLLLLAALPWALSAQNIAINATGAAAATQAMLDVSSTTKGMLAPRMTAAQRTAIAAPAQGLTVYQVDAPKGFYYFQGTWQYIGAGGGVSWDLTGNTMPTSTDPNTNFLGATNAQPLIFRTNNVERMRILGSNGYLGVGTTTPTERLYVEGGGLRIFSDLTTTGTTGTGTYSNMATANSNFVHSLTNQAGVVMYQHWPYRVGTAAGAWPSDTVMWAGHWGNVSNTAASTLPGSAPAPPNPGGWQRLGNDYNEVVRAAAATWDHPPGMLCATPGNALFPPGGAGAPSSAPLLIPFGITTPGNTFRQQYLFRAAELNLETSSATLGVNNPNGLCPGEPITAVSFYFSSPTPAAKVMATLSVTVKNIPASFNSMNTVLSFVDPEAGCHFTQANTTIPVGTSGWYSIPLTDDFKWDGVSNVIVEVAGRTVNAHAALSMAVYTPAWAGPLNYPTYALNKVSCLPPGNPQFCGGLLNLPGNLNLGSCGGVTTFGSNTQRPVIRFTGQVATVDPSIITSGTGGRYLQYPGGFMVETVSGTLPWGRKMTAPYNFKGPGTLVAQRGVYDSGTRLNDHVFDRAFDGRVHPDDAAEMGDQRNLTMEEMATHTRTERHLPTMKGRAEWEAEGGFSLGDLTNQLWTTTETHALYLTGLHDRLNTLEVLTNGRPLNGAEAVQARTDLLRMRTLTDAEKALLVRSLTERTTSVNTTR